MADSVFNPDSFDESRIIDESKSIGGILTKFGNELIEDLKSSIEKHQLRDTGNLRQSLDFKVDLFGSAFTFQFMLADYYDYIDKGVQGAGGKKADGSLWKNKGGNSEYKYFRLKPPVNFSNVDGQSLRQWAKRKGISEYAVRESIFRQGKKARPFYSEVVTDARLDQLKKDLAKAVAYDVGLVTKVLMKKGLTVK